MADRAVRVVIKGSVQGVGFRAHLQHEAAQLGVSGWVRNRVDGAVEALFEGADEPVAALLRWCHVGPPSAEVSDVSSETVQPTGSRRGFHIRL